MISRGINIWPYSLESLYLYQYLTRYFIIVQAWRRNKAPGGYAHAIQKRSTLTIISAIIAHFTRQRRLNTAHRVTRTWIYGHKLLELLWERAFFWLCIFLPAVWLGNLEFEHHVFIYCVIDVRITIRIVLCSVYILNDNWR